MSHVSETNLIRLAAAELSDGQRREIEAHLESCAECRKAFEQHRALRAVLGDWQVETDLPDQWPAIDQRLDDWQSATIRPGWTRAGRIGRVAAAIVLGVGTGYVGGRILGARGGALQAVPMVSAEEVLDALGFHFIELPSATGLFTTVSDLTSAAEAGDAS
ncbi:MAG: zf-HC2 domain-containing protein [Planctomycetes bacterium]|nr:zf-HC2 domain-containing protein [Planctomycetota bacterium]